MFEGDFFVPVGATTNSMFTHALHGRLLCQTVPKDIGRMGTTTPPEEGWAPWLVPVPGGPPGGPYNSTMSVQYKDQIKYLNNI